jgi:hypothetical protein
MAIQGIYAYRMYAYKVGGGYHTASWTMAISPSNAFAQVQEVDVFSFQDESRTEVGFTNVTDVNGNSQSFPAPNLDWLSNSIVYRAQMTTITLTARVSGCLGNWVVQIFTF